MTPSKEAQRIADEFLSDLSEDRIADPSCTLACLLQGVRDGALDAACEVAEREERICAKQAVGAGGTGRVSIAAMHRAGSGLAKSIAAQIHALRGERARSKP